MSAQTVPAPLAEREPGEDDDDPTPAFRAAGQRARAARSPSPWPTMLPAAFHGPLGEAATLIEPLTEADPAAVLVQLLVAFGNCVGRGVRLALGSVVQWTNLFVVIVGKSSKARKGTSWNNALDVIRAADTGWAATRIKSGLSTGEGVIHAVRDAVMAREAIREGDKRTGRVVDYQQVEEDSGETDKRLLVVEAEFARALKVAARKENVLSAVLRAAWDDGALGVLTKAPYVATGAHVSIVGHITKEELLREMSASDSINGFANRFLWIYVRRSKELACGNGSVSEVTRGVTARLGECVRRVRAQGDDYVVSFDPACLERWRTIYSELSADRPGLVGAILGRAEAQVPRLALVYALADGEDVIRVCHLEAALAMWRYAEDSARAIFGASLGDPIADEIVRALRESPQGMMRDELRNHFGRNESATRLGAALTMLTEHGLVGMRKEPPRGGKGQTGERWFAMPSADAVDAVDAENETAGLNTGVNRVNRVNRVAEEDRRQERAGASGPNWDAPF